MDNPLKDFVTAAEKVQVNDSKLSAIAGLAKVQIVMQEDITAAEEALSVQRAALRRIQTEDIPAAMDEVGMSEFTLEDGPRVIVKPFYQASIPKPRREEAFDWLTEHDSQDIIKVTVTVNFQREEYDQALELAKTLQQEGYSAIPAMSVHPSTLKSWVRNMVEENNEFPLDLFGAFIGRISTIK